MATKAKKTKAAGRKKNPGEALKVEQARELARAVKLEKKIHTLARQLERVRETRESALDGIVLYLSAHGYGQSAVNRAAVNS